MQIVQDASLANSVVTFVRDASGEGTWVPSPLHFWCRQSEEITNDVDDESDKQESYGPAVSSHTSSILSKQFAFSLKVGAGFAWQRHCVCQDSLQRVPRG